jgi:NAD(P)H-dependent FMN reductase
MLLEAVARSARKIASFRQWRRIGDMPVFSPDLEGERTPGIVLDLAKEVRSADGLVFAVPEYAHGIPGGLKNALDWLVSRDEIPFKPAIMIHASDRNRYARRALAEVLRTMSLNLVSEDALTIHLLGKSPAETASILSDSENLHAMSRAIGDFISTLNDKPA